MGTKVSPEFELLAFKATEDYFLDAIGEVVEVIIYLPEAFSRLFGSITEAWPVPGVFNDDLAIPHPQTKMINGIQRSRDEVTAAVWQASSWTPFVRANGSVWDPWFQDLNVSASGWTDVVIKTDDDGEPILDANGNTIPQSSIDGAAISRKTALLLTLVIAMAVASFFGIKKLPMIMGVVYAKLFGVKGKLKGMEAKLDEILDVLAAMDPSSTGSEETASSDQILDQIRVIKDVLGNADGEIGGLIEGLLLNRRAPVINKDWFEGVDDPLKEDIKIG